MDATASGEALVPTLLIVDDEPIIGSLCSELALGCGLAPRIASTTEEALRILGQERISGLITDINVPELGGMNLMKRVRQDFPAVDTFVLTQYGTVDTAVEAMRLGAIDYVQKPFMPEEFQKKLQMWMQCPRFDLTKKVEPFGLLGQSSKMREVQTAIAKLSQMNSSVLILGESGTGKEVAARCIHRLSLRASYPFVPVDCAGLAPSLIESELFGYTRGAFTGAANDRMGLFESADKGTLFLDEIGELPVSLQAKLLRVIQEKCVRRIGSTQVLPLNVRVIAATNRELKEAMSKGQFREDLYYRLNVIQMVLPPLRERKTDIPVLVEAFLNKHADPYRPIVRVEGEFMHHLLCQPWPGNVRELENTIERSIV